MPGSDRASRAGEGTPLRFIPRSTKLYLNSNTPCFPVGVFYNATNHYLCDSKDLEKYISKVLLDDEGKQRADSLQSVSSNVIIQYHLR